MNLLLQKHLLQGESDKLPFQMHPVPKLATAVSKTISRTPVQYSNCQHFIKMFQEEPQKLLRLLQNNQFPCTNNDPVDADENSEQEMENVVGIPSNSSVKEIDSVGQLQARLNALKS